MDSLYSLREWIYECERFLFLAEVHYHKKDVTPSKHQFACEMDGTLLELMLSHVEEVYKNCSSDLCFTSCLSPEELHFLKKTLDDVCLENWEQTGLENVLESQKILHKLGQAVDSDIMHAYELKGYSSFYKLCGLRYA